MPQTSSSCFLMTLALRKWVASVLTLIHQTLTRLRPMVCSSPTFTSRHCARLHVRLSSVVVLTMQSVCAPCRTSSQVFRTSLVTSLTMLQQLPKFLATRVMEHLQLVNGTLHQWSNVLLQARLISGHLHVGSIASTDSLMVKQISSTLNLLQTITLLMHRALQKRATTSQKILLIKHCTLFLTSRVFDLTVRSLATLHLVQHTHLTKHRLHTWRNIAASTTKVGTSFASVGSRSKLQLA